MKTFKRIQKYMGYAIIFLLLGPLCMLFSDEVQLGLDWRTAPHDSSGQAPDPAKTEEAVVQVYAARAFSWRAAFAVHTWIAVKEKGADEFVRYEVIGWRLHRNKSVVSIESSYAPDAEWFGAKPHILKDIRGEKAELIIEKMKKVAKKYPHTKKYSSWPGPNSNTFIAYLARSIPELELKLPAIALGKDFMYDYRIFGKAPSNTGYQLSLFGLFGITIAKKEGLEINLLTLVIGIDFEDKKIKFPGVL